MTVFCQRVAVTDLSVPWVSYPDRKLLGVAFRKHLKVNQRGISQR